jgi:hypothetical protein
VEKTENQQMTDNRNIIENQEMLENWLKIKYREMIGKLEIGNNNNK